MAEFNCNEVPACRAYLEEVRQSVFAKWSPADDVPGGGVRVAFRLESTGRLTDIRILRSDSQKLAESCRTAMQATDAPDVPENVTPLLRQRIVATFDFSRNNSP